MTAAIDTAQTVLRIVCRVVDILSFSSDECIATGSLTAVRTPTCKYIFVRRHCLSTSRGRPGDDHVQNFVQTSLARRAFSCFSSLSFFRTASNSVSLFRRYLQGCSSVSTWAGFEEDDEEEVAVAKRCRGANGRHEDEAVGAALSPIAEQIPRDVLASAHRLASLASLDSLDGFSNVPERENRSKGVEGFEGCKVRSG